METKLTRSQKFVTILVVNLIIIAILLYGFEYYFQWTDPASKLPFDTNYYTYYGEYYDDVEIPQGEIYTWGHLVVDNRFGFRERDFEVPKPTGVCRIMILGDSLTWGAGLALEERYTNLLEISLKQAFSDKRFEVLNFAMPSGPTVMERDILRDFKTYVSPDLIVVGFVLNDPQPRGEDYRIEKEQFEKQYGHILDSITQSLISLNLPQIARLTRKATDNLLVNLGIVPRFEVGLQRTYEEDSKEWVEFEQALKDIKATSDELNLPSPILSILNQGIYLDHPTDYRDQGEGLPIRVRWYHQAEQAAAKIGFRTHNHEAELIEQLTPAEIPVNALDGHPSVKVNLIYAQKLFDTIATDVRRGELCANSSTEAPSLADLPLSNQRLMSVRLGDRIRFLGYVADEANIEEEQELRLSFGWQAIGDVNSGYTIFIHLLDGDGQQWAAEDSLPCRGDCPTNHWRQGMLMTPPDFSMLYRSSSDTLWMKTAEPWSSFTDDHEIAMATQTPPGKYTLVMGMYDTMTGERLAAYDEVTESWLPEAQVVLGKITIP